MAPFLTLYRPFAPADPAGSNNPARTGRSTSSLTRLGVASPSPAGRWQCPGHAAGIAFEGSCALPTRRGVVDGGALAPRSPRPRGKASVPVNDRPLSLVLVSAGDIPRTRTLLVPPIAPHLLFPFLWRSSAFGRGGSSLVRPSVCSPAAGYQSLYYGGNTPTTSLFSIFQSMGVEMVRARRSLLPPPRPLHQLSPTPPAPMLVVPTGATVRNFTAWVSHRRDAEPDLRPSLRAGGEGGERVGRVAGRARNSRSTGTTRRATGPIYAQLFIDGVESCSTHFMLDRVGHPQDASCIGISYATTSEYTRRDFVFSKIVVTDDDAYLHTLASPPSFGTIRLELWEAEITGIRRAPYQHTYRDGGASLESKVIHETSKKAGAHHVRFDAEYVVPPPIVNIVSGAPKGEAPLARFTFNYRPAGMLRASGIIPQAWDAAASGVDCAVVFAVCACWGWDFQRLRVIHEGIYPTTTGATSDPYFEAYGKTARRRCFGQGGAAGCGQH
ncbi:hypothetical protein HMN09_01404600 [Mycena chlorophos]|uniref:DUF7918 domain-containing protein n=1 Tax=Mycena chlorophos TaxID=658473 RepID=A0A8H6VSE1_MYCCL|nr:hypothetical protein HMN09_01404600 [Mycena chlorophos]